MRAIAVFLALAALSWFPLSANAKSNEYVHMIEAGAPITIAPDKAYTLIRLQSRWKQLTVVLMRMPSDNEMSKYEVAKQVAYSKAGKKSGPYDQFSFNYDGTPNLFSIPFDRELMKLPDSRIILAEIPPGDYVLYGEGYSRFITQCFCLGTVRFTLKPGVVTDLGTIAIDYAWKPASIPLLAPVSGLGNAAKLDYVIMAVGLRAAAKEDVVPSGISRDQIENAQFQAVGPYVDSKTLLISRLAPVDGVLAYDNGRVIDVPSGKELPGNE